MNLNLVFNEIKKNAIKVDFKTKCKKELPLGTSKFGGNPDVPTDFEWFYYKGQDSFGEIKSRPLSFLAQINCKEVRKYDKDNLLPQKGMIYFFYELSTMTWGSYPHDKGSARVFYFDGDITELKRTDFPDDLQEKFKLPEMKLDFSKKYDLPDYEEFIKIYDYKDWDKYDEMRSFNGYMQNESAGKLLGYADLIQGEMLLNCEMVLMENYNCDISQITPDELNEWQLLFQLDSVTTDDFELMFGDCGRIYFYIRKEDLKNCNFDNCWLILQCG